MKITRKNMTAVSALLGFLLTTSIEAAPVYLIGAVGTIPTLLLVNNLATNLALLGAAKLGIAAVGGKSAIPEAMEEIKGYAPSSIYKHRRQSKPGNKEIGTPSLKN